MQNTLRLCSAFLAILVLALAGCAKKDTVDTAPLENSFKTAEPAKQQTADQVVASIKAGEYGAAFASLQNLATQSALTPEQQKAIKDTLTALQEKLSEATKKMAEEGKKAVDEGKKAMDDMKKALPKLN